MRDKNAPPAAAKTVEFIFFSSVCAAHELNKTIQDIRKKTCSPFYHTNNNKPIRKRCALSHRFVMIMCDEVLKFCFCIPFVCWTTTVTMTTTIKTNFYVWGVLLYFSRVSMRYLFWHRANSQFNIKHVFIFSDNIK